MARRGIVILTAAIWFSSTIPVAAESSWHWPTLWSSKSSSEKPRPRKKPASKKKAEVEQVSWLPDLNASQHIKNIAEAPVHLARRVGSGSKHAYQRTRDVVTAPFRSHDLPAPKKSKSKPKSKSLLSNPFAKKEQPKEDLSLTEWLRQPRPEL